MKILYVFSIYLPLTGGCQDPIDQAVPYMMSQGHEVHVLTKRWPQDLPDTESINGAIVHRVDSAILPDELEHMAHHVKKIVQEVQPDAIHVIGLRRPLPFFALLAGRWLGVPVVMTVGGWDIPDPSDPEPGKVWTSGKHLIRNAMLQADQVNAASKDLTRLVRLEFPELDDIPVMRVGIDTQLFREATPTSWPRPYVLSLRRLEDSKQVDHVIRAFAEPAVRNLDVDLLVAGDGQQAGMLRHLVQDFGLKERVHFLGEVDIQQAASLMKGASLTTVVSRAEGGGLVNIEAQAAGTPILATRVGGITEYVGGDQGAHFIENTNPGLLAQEIRRCLTDSVLRTSLINYGYQHAKDFETRYLVEGYINVYRSLISTAQNRGFEPWSKLTAKLWNIFCNTDNLPLFPRQNALIAQPSDLDGLGAPANRWWYTRAEIFGQKEWPKSESHALHQLRDKYGDKVVRELLAEAAEWGRTDVSALFLYAESAREEFVPREI
ncbi:glycosyltransferase [Corynebacterium macginleyi]|uniref:glycosyltransferase family 4 protein n=1 Tax=Corynebacterium macginleyi TaxID=38290 RepID=UPI00190A258D|nr:glycosyltransferase family 4 protein [Corynebacterium macginleyi]MBK4166305.1 glycosyltransferase [Corynebacterium macginleyi]